jgi:hypothetical protein
MQEYFNMYVLLGWWHNFSLAVALHTVLNVAGKQRS